MNEGKVQVVVRSRRVPARVVEVSRPQLSFAGVWVGKETDRFLIYEAKLDEEHQNALDEGRRIANQMGLRLEVVDESKSSLPMRFLARLGAVSAGHPRLIITPSHPAGPTCGTHTAFGASGSLNR